VESPILKKEFMGDEEDSWLHGLGVDVADTLSRAAQTVEDTASSAVQSVSDTASSAVQTVADTTSDAVQSASEVVSDTGQAVVTGASSAADCVTDTTSEVAQTVSNTLSDVGPALVDGGFSAAQSVADTASEVTETVSDTLSEAGQAVADGASSVVDSVTDAASNVAETVSDTVTDASANVSNLMQNAEILTSKTWDEVKDGVSKLLHGDPDKVVPTIGEPITYTAPEVNQCFTQYAMVEAASIGLTLYGLDMALIIAGADGVTGVIAKLIAKAFTTAATITILTQVRTALLTLAQALDAWIDCIESHGMDASEPKRAAAAVRSAIGVVQKKIDDAKKI
jgi:hypothetical protein